MQTDGSSFTICHTQGKLYVAFLIMIHIFVELSFAYQIDYEGWYPLEDPAYSLESSC